MRLHPALLAVAAFSLALSIAGCGSDSHRPDAHFSQAVKFDLQNDRFYMRSARRRGLIQSVRCGEPQQIVGGFLVGCLITFARSGRERWFVVGTDQFIVRPCATPDKALAALVESVCPEGV